MCNDTHIHFIKIITYLLHISTLISSILISYYTYTYFPTSRAQLEEDTSYAILVIPSDLSSTSLEFLGKGRKLLLRLLLL